MVLTRRDDALRGAHAPTAGSRSGAGRTPGDVGRSSRPTGRNPLADQSTDRFTPLADEQAHRAPAPRATTPTRTPTTRSRSSSTRRPRPTSASSTRPSHNWEDQGGHRGEHGSLGLVQSRAPLVFAGKGVRAPRRRRRARPGSSTSRRRSPRCSAARRTPTVSYLATQDGDVLDDVLDPNERPSHVVGFLFDGTNANVLYDMAARGEAPNVARLIDMGTAFGHGAMASLPTVTLANHTTILTGAHPGHHGILHNAWYDRARGEQIITNSSATWPTAMDHLTPGIESIHDAVHRTWPDAFTASVNEPCDTGADYSTFDFFRRGEVPPIPSSPEGLPHTTERFVRPSKDYAWSSVVDHMGVEQATGILSGHYRDVELPAARASCGATSRSPTRRCTKAARTRRSRPRRCATATRALGEVLARDRAARRRSTTPRSCSSPTTAWKSPTRRARGDWDVALRAAGLEFRDEGYGFLYFGV